MLSPEALRKKCETAPLEELIEEARKISWDYFGEKVEFFYSYHQEISSRTKLTRGINVDYKADYIKEIKDSLTPTTPILSLSGARCELKCEHCKTMYLRAMRPAGTPEELYEIAKECQPKGTKAMMLSAGSNKKGETMISPDFYDAIRRIKKDFGYYIGVMFGYGTRQRVKEMKALGVNSIILDVIGDEETMGNVYHLECSMSAIEDTIRYTFEEGIDVIPHICIGLNFGKITGEYAGIEMLTRYPIKLLNYIVITPTLGTPMADIDIPSPEQIARILIYSRFRLPRALHHLGCTRPIRGNYAEAVEAYAVRLGCNRISGISSDLPTRICDELGAEYNFSPHCCMYGNTLFDHLLTDD